MLLPLGFDSLDLIGQASFLSAIGQELKSHANQTLVDIVAKMNLL